MRAGAGPSLTEAVNTNDSRRASRPARGHRQGPSDRAKAMRLIRAAITVPLLDRLPSAIRSAALDLPPPRQYVFIGVRRIPNNFPHLTALRCELKTEFTCPLLF